MAALPAFDTLLKNKGLSGRAATHSSTAPVLGYFIEKQYGLSKDSLPFNDAVVAYIEKKRVPHVVLIANWGMYDLSMKSALIATVKKLVAIGSQPWIMLQVPSHPVHVGKLLHRWPAALSDLNQKHLCGKPGTWNGIVDADDKFLHLLTSAGARIIDPRAAFLNERRDLYQIVMDGKFLYRDGDHLSKFGAEKILIPILERSFSPSLTTSQLK